MKSIMFLLRKINKIASSSNNDKKQSIDSIERYAYGTNEDQSSKK